ncbi:hypothetical protein BQ8420_23760 [Nocardiopsis sp. JB363]|nr:hypothetical protein BQ8420_23760 [Nocardiopsis sp. JB363]
MLPALGRFGTQIIVQRCKKPAYGAEGLRLAHFDFVDASQVVGFTRERWASVSTNSSTRAPEVFDLDDLLGRLQQRNHQISP